MSLVTQTRDKRAKYDCVVPVSGGKDSTWQTVKALEVGLRPLCVTWRTPARSAVGENNLRNLISLAWTILISSINPRLSISHA